MNMGFIVLSFIETHDEKEYYYICINCNNERYFLKTAIAKLLDMDSTDYIQLLNNYNILDSYTFLFKNEMDAQKFADYLNDKYLVLIKLQGKL